jgi:hypothetical protein
MRASAEVADDISSIKRSYLHVSVDRYNLRLFRPMLFSPLRWSGPSVCIHTVGYARLVLPYFGHVEAADFLSADILAIVSFTNPFQHFTER